MVTGLGAVTPIGNDARATWRAAVAGESGVDWIRAFDASEFPVRIAAEVKDFDPTAVASPKEVRKLERNVLLALGAGREAVADAGLDGAYSPDRVGILFGTAIGGFLGMVEQGDILRERGLTPVSRRRSSRACSPTRRAGSSRSRSASAGRTTRRCPRARPARTRSARRRSSSSAATPTPCSRAAPRRACIRSSSPASARCAASSPRRSIRGAPRGRSTRRAPASSWARARASSCSRRWKPPGSAARRSTRRSSATARRTTRTTWRSRTPSSSASPR